MLDPVISYQTPSQFIVTLASVPSMTLSNINVWSVYVLVNHFHVDLSMILPSTGVGTIWTLIFNSRMFRPDMVIGTSSVLVFGSTYITNIPTFISIV